MTHTNIEDVGKWIPLLAGNQAANIKIIKEKLYIYCAFSARVKGLLHGSM